MGLAVLMGADLSQKGHIDQRADLTKKSNSTLLVHVMLTDLK